MTVRFVAEQLAEAMPIVAAVVGAAERQRRGARRRHDVVLRKLRGVRYELAELRGRVDELARR